MCHGVLRRDDLKRQLPFQGNVGSSSKLEGGLLLNSSGGTAARDTSHRLHERADLGIPFPQLHRYATKPDVLVRPAALEPTPEAFVLNAGTHTLAELPRACAVPSVQVGESISLVCEAVGP